MSVTSEVKAGQNDFLPAAVKYIPRRQDLLGTVKNGTTVSAPSESGQRTSLICHLNNIAMRTGKEFTWNRAMEESSDAEVKSLLTPSMREPWTLS